MRTITIKVPDDGYTIIDDAAKTTGNSLSGWCRDALIATATDDTRRPASAGDVAELSGKVEQYSKSLFNQINKQADRIIEACEYEEAGDE